MTDSENSNPRVAVENSPVCHVHACLDVMLLGKQCLSCFWKTLYELCRSSAQRVCIHVPYFFPGSGLKHQRICQVPDYCISTRTKAVLAYDNKIWGCGGVGWPCRGVLQWTHFLIRVVNKEKGNILIRPPSSRVRNLSLFDAYLVEMGIVFDGIWNKIMEWSD